MIVWLDNELAHGYHGYQYVKFYLVNAAEQRE